MNFYLTAYASYAEIWRVENHLDLRGRYKTAKFDKLILNKAETYTSIWYLHFIYILVLMHTLKRESDMKTTHRINDNVNTVT